MIIGKFCKADLPDNNLNGSAVDMDGEYIFIQIRSKHRSTIFPVINFMIVFPCFV